MSAVEFLLSLKSNNFSCVKENGLYKILLVVKMIIYRIILCEYQVALSVFLLC